MGTVIKDVVLPDTLIGIKYFTFIDPSGTEINVYEGGSNHDLYNVYEITSNSVVDSHAYPDMSRADYYQGIESRNLFFRKKSGTVTPSYLFQRILNGENVYISLRIPGAITKVKINDGSGNDYGFNIERTEHPDYPMYIYLRLYSSPGKRTTININDFLGSRNVDFLSSTSIGRSLPLIGDAVDYYDHADPVIEVGERGLYSEVHDWRVTLDEPQVCTIIKKEYEETRVSQLYQDCIRYSKGEVVYHKGSRYSLVIDSSLDREPGPFSLIWKKI